MPRPTLSSTAAEQRKQEQAAAAKAAQAETQKHVREKAPKLAKNLDNFYPDGVIDLS